MVKRHLSLKDFAYELNISISTVSRVLKAAELFFKKMDDPDFAESVVLQTTLLVSESSLRK